ncbi:MAG: hypothetical protein ACK55I_20445, partial [bacterium]
RSTPPNGQPGDLSSSNPLRTAGSSSARRTTLPIPSTTRKAARRGGPPAHSRCRYRRADPRRRTRNSHGLPSRC